MRGGSGNAPIESGDTDQSQTTVVPWSKAGRGLCSEAPREP